VDKKATYVKYKNCSGPERLFKFRYGPISLPMRLLIQFISDESGGEVLEYALIAGLIAIAAITVIAAVGTSVVGQWTSVNSSM